jgi:hypothetical protein
MALVALVLLVGLPLALGTAPAIANLAAGMMIRGLHLYREGDRVRAAGLAGIIESSGLLVTRLRTAGNELVVVPNALVLNGVIIVDSDALAAREHHGGPAGDTAIAPPGWVPPMGPLGGTHPVFDLFQQAVRAVEAARLRTASRR